MKGAALLLNLKEQNNTLIQMILDKDVQIRKLLTEIKTSKLYATSRRTESYRNEIDRLRNLLIKSQNVMKESQEMPQRRSICVGGTPTLEMTLSSDLSSPRDLEELQCTIQSLEMHMKYSNELLAKKK
ncbi:UNVERIFIED_CONTAM: hypothetical protein PYX00_005298 [Menopon gallinae]|uniref:Uncharacterized protein n=1 Tax=Menopon gallinae TaxID=328185 RepID=A0AAW2HQS3_9NEOP